MELSELFMDILLATVPRVTLVLNKIICDEQPLHSFDFIWGIINNLLFNRHQRWFYSFLKDTIYLFHS